MKTKEKKWVLTDCDGVWLGRTRERGGYNNRYDYANLLMQLEMMGQNGGYEFVALTDRGGAQLAPLAYVFHFSLFQGGESGAVAYNTHSHSVIAHPYFRGIIRKVDAIRRCFEKKFNGYYALEPGVYSGIRVERHNGDDMKPAFDFLSAAAQKSEHLICADHGDCISLKPREINKLVGIQWLKSLYQETGNPIDFTRALWIGDGNSDIPAAKFVLENGGKIAGVANSQPGYAEFIRKNNGYVAMAAHTRGMIEILKEFAG
jgi:hypothetical protein